MSISTVTSTYLRRANKIKSFSSFKELWNEVNTDDRINGYERNLVLSSIKRLSSILWYDRAVRRYQNTNGISFPTVNELPWLPSSNSFPGMMIEAWAIYMVHLFNGKERTAIAEQILSEYFPGRYEDMPFSQVSWADKKGFYLRDTTYYHVKVKNKDKTKSNNVQVRIYRDYDKSPQIYTYQYIEES